MNLQPKPKLSESASSTEIPYQDRNVVRISGDTLKIILQDEALTKVFLMLCNICSMVVGSSITPT